MNRLIVLAILASLAACGRHEGDPPTALMEAAGRGDLSRVRTLIAAGANVNDKRGVHRVSGMAVEGDNPIAGETALLYAIQSNHLEIARALLDAGARIDVKDTWGRPVWHYLELAIGRNAGAPMTRLVLSLKNLPVVDEYFLQARRVARDAGNDEVVLLLTEYLASHQPGDCVARPTERQGLCGKQT